LAFELGEGEYDLPEILAEPLAEVILALKENGCYDEMVQNFPDRSYI
jgi:HrpA-like RNA helicase